MVTKLHSSSAYFSKPPLDLWHRGVVVLFEQPHSLVGNAMHVAGEIVVRITKRDRVSVYEGVLVRTSELIIVRQARAPEETALHRGAGQMAGGDVVVIRAVVHHGLPVGRL